MRIAMVTEFVSPTNKAYSGGVDARAKYLAKHLAEKHDVTILCSHLKGIKRVETSEGYVIRRVGVAGEFVQRGRFLQRYNFARAVASEIPRRDFDLVDASGFVAYPGAYRGAIKANIPVVATVHEVWQGRWIRNIGVVNGVLGHLLERRYLRLPFHHYIAVSNFTRMKLITRLGIPKESISVVYNGIDQALYDSVVVDERYPEPTIISIGRLVRYKRFDSLLKALKLLKEDIPQVRLIIVGDGPEKERLESMSRDLSLEKDVHFIGKVNDTRELIRIMKRCHVFSLPSIVEGFGMVLIEAMACGLPYVASDIKVLRETTSDGEGGFLFDPFDLSQFKERLREALMTPNWNKRGVPREYHWDVVAHELESVYRSISGN